MDVRDPRTHAGTYARMQFTAVCAEPENRMEEESGEETTVTANTRTEGRRAAVLGCRDDRGPRAVRL